MDSIWDNDVKMPRFPHVQGDIRTDVLVIGGGLAGLLCAWNLTRRGVDCVLIEQDRLLSGVSGRTTAKLTAQHGLIYSKLLDKLGCERARLYYQANADALAAFGEIADKEKWDYQTQNSYIYATGSTQKLEQELEACERLRIPAQWESFLPLPFSVTGAVAFANQAQFHPLKLAAHIAKGLRIFENTKAQEFSVKQVKTPSGTVTAEKIIVATHFPILNKHGAYFL